MQIYTTADGGTIEATRRGLEIDLHVRNAAGRTVATVVMSESAAESLLAELGVAVWE
ncbi:hypothetical protein OHA79_09455 [Streptomyces sp. NBC_00841]|uniref:hypothetical protein n=1 Tax=Streptomyces sp. NBC_00841 TaxID=2975847 RepID=UPI002DDAF473|nr:hypothetical protein [Streptomyces sp. NBC_00841]WRZ98040.1 hypothetical protein OHA79_09455 [Streptomyces sp. NBC_00841]